MDELKKNLSSLFGRAEDKILSSKINSLLKNAGTEDIAELCQKIKTADKNALLNKLDEYDQSKLTDLNLNINELKEKFRQLDSDKLTELLGENGQEIINKVKNILDLN